MKPEDTSAFDIGILDVREWTDTDCQHKLGFISCGTVLSVEWSPLGWMVRLGEKEMGMGTRRLAVEFVWSQVAPARWTLKISGLLLFRY